MSDIVARLRKRRESELIGGYERVEWEDKDAIEAADKIDDLCDENTQLVEENEKLRALLKRHFARKPEPECQIVDDKKCDACVCGWGKWKTDEMALEDETHAALQDKSDE